MNLSQRNLLTRDLRDVAAPGRRRTFYVRWSFDGFSRDEQVL